VHATDIGAQAPRLKRTRLAGRVATVIVTVVFSYIALRGVDFKDAGNALRECNYWWLIPMLITFGIALGMRGLRWRSLFAYDRRPGRGVVCNAMLVGYLYNNIMPARAGEAARVMVLNQRAGTPAVETVGTVLLERLYDVAAVLIIFFAAKPWLPDVKWVGTAAVLAGVLAAGIVVAAIVLTIYGDRPVRFVLRPLRRFSHFSGDRLEHTIDELVHGLSGLRHHGVALQALAWTLGAWLMSALSTWLLTLAFPLHLPLSSGIMVTVCIGLAMILPSAPAAIGVFEGAAIIGLKAYGISKTDALPYALVLHLANFIPFVLLGVLALQHNARHPVRRPAPEVSASVPIPAGSTPVGP
jgi:glycosyltransferase 2 family protein